MKITFKYGDSVLCLPAKAVSEKLSEASADELRVILTLAINPASDTEDICEELGMDPKAFDDALHFWRGAGAISLQGSADKVSSQKRSAKASNNRTEANTSDKMASDKKVEVRLQSGAVPTYTTAQIADIIESDSSIHAYIDNCQQILGKILSTAETSTLIGIVQYLGVTTEYVALLCVFAVSHGKKSVRYIEKMALGLFDSGITKYSELELHLKRLNKAEDMQPEIRRIFGMGDRALTTKEKAFIENWCAMELDLDLIVKAYEITVTNTGKPAIAYTNSILEKWHAEGYTTCEEVDNAAREYKKKKDRANNSGGSFDTDDFFEAALKRSYAVMEGD